jgi:hypothetical protein
MSANRYLLRGALGGVCWAFLADGVVETLRISPGNGWEAVVNGAVFWPFFTASTLYHSSSTGIMIGSCCPVLRVVTFSVFEGLVGVLSGLSISALVLAVGRLRSRLFRAGDGSSR